MTKKKTNRARGWAFTYNNPDSSRKRIYKQSGADYVIIGKEVGKNGTPHYQGYLYYKNKKSFNSLKELFPEFHIEAAKSSDMINIAYCMKDGDYKEFGTRPRQGHRSDLDVIRNDIEFGKSDYDIASENFGKWCQYRRSFTEYRRLHQVQNRRTLLSTTSVDDYTMVNLIDSGYLICDGFDESLDPSINPKIVFMCNFNNGMSRMPLLKLLSRGFREILIPDTVENCNFCLTYNYIDGEKEV